MSIDFSALNKINEGKTKVIYDNPDDPKTVFMRFKDDITAGDGAKHDIIEGKAFRQKTMEFGQSMFMT